jgi:VanZ family protein
MLLALRHPRVWLVIGWLLVAASVYASLIPSYKLPPAGVNDKIEHFAAYVLLTLWFTGIYPRSRYVVIAIGLFCLGLFIEWAQGAMNVGRQADVRDILANSIGISVGVALALLWLGGWAQRLETWTRRS